MVKPLSSFKERVFYVETARQKVLEVLLKYPDQEFSLSDLAKEAGVAKANIGIIIDYFYKLEFLEVTKLSKIWRIRANIKNWYFIKTKIIHNLNLLYQSGLIEFLNDYYGHPKAIILFGSFRKGEDISSSDIDIAIEVDEDKVKESKVLYLKQIVEPKLEKIVEIFEKNLGRKIQLFLFNKKNVDLNLFNNIANGIVLLGFLEVKP